MSDETVVHGREQVIVASKIKNYIKNQGCMVSADALEMLNLKVYELLDSAINRTRENKRTTLRPHDF